MTGQGNGSFVGKVRLHVEKSFHSSYCLLPSFCGSCISVSLFILDLFAMSVLHGPSSPYVSHTIRLLSFKSGSPRTYVLKAIMEEFVFLMHYYLWVKPQKEKRNLALMRACKIYKTHRNGIAWI